MMKRSTITALTPNVNPQPQVILDLGVCTHFHMAVLQYSHGGSRDGGKLYFLCKIDKRN